MGPDVRSLGPVIKISETSQHYVIGRVRYSGVELLAMTQHRFEALLLSAVDELRVRAIAAD